MNYPNASLVAEYFAPTRTIVVEEVSILAPARLTTADVACWVIKSRIVAPRLVADWVPGGKVELARCLRRSYRVELMRRGDPCLLWVSGRDQPGVHAIGTLVGRATVEEVTDPSRAELKVTVGLTLLGEPVARSALLSDHVFADAEVLRMPAGSNPSYLSPPTFAALRDFLSPEDQRRAGWQ
ncbi:MAG TPA: hypothetical protein VF635_01750 [Propionibacteriaceae bacterium]